MSLRGVRSLTDTQDADHHWHDSLVTSHGVILLFHALDRQWQPKDSEEGSFPEAEKEITTYNPNEVDTAYGLLAEHINKWTPESLF